MGQIVKGKKKGRPSKADLALRAAAGAEPTPPRDIRRSLRRRSLRYNIDFDDYQVDDDDDDEEDEEEERRREKKLKLVLKLPHQARVEIAEPVPSRTRRVAHAPPISASSSEYGEGNKPFKKRKMDGDDAGDEDEDEDDNDDEINNGCDDDDDDNDGDYQHKGRKPELKEHDSLPGTPSDRPSGVPLPEKKFLELILDKLQKKDVYGVYAEPVDPEELPDYHDIIEHPMDFATVRKKLANGSYSTLKQFESDVLLICANAMQYNAPETIYFKQARSIQELARKKFQRLRNEIERSDKELKSEQKVNSNSAKKSIKKPIGRTIQEPVGSDFSSGATLAMAGDIHNGSNTKQNQPSFTEGVPDVRSSLIDNSLEKTEDIYSGKGLPMKFGKKSFPFDENRRATYNISNQPHIRSESIFTTFDGENKQLVAVGLHSDHSYARSLARFAATLGPVAWKVASKRIEEALPAGFKFGCGWVGEYEPLPTPVLLIENRNKGQPAFASNSSTTILREKNEIHTNQIPPNWEGKKAALFGFRVTNNRVTATDKQQNPLPRNFAETENKNLKQVELNSPPSADKRTVNFAAEKQLSNVPDVEMLSKSTNGAVASPNGKPVTNSCDSNRMINSSPKDFLPNQSTGAGTYFPHGNEHGLTDPVQLMRKSAEKSQAQQKSLNNSRVDNSFQRRNDSSNNAATAAARAWMSIGSNSPKNQISAHSLYNPSREIHSQIPSFRGEFPAVTTNFPQLVQKGNEVPFQVRQMGFPQVVNWQGLTPHSQAKQKQESLPPDLNIGYQTSGSPVRQPSGVILDSQQPDLALQL